MGFVNPPAAAGSSGTVTTVSVVTANGVSGTVANPTTTPALTLDVTGAGQTVSTITGAVATGTTAFAFDDNVPPNTRGDQYMSLAITPLSATSKLVITVTVYLSNTNTNATLSAALFQDSTSAALAVGSVIGPTATGIFQIVFTYVMTSGTTSSTTLKVRAGGTTGATTTFNGTSGSRNMGGAFASGIVIREELP